VQSGAPHGSRLLNLFEAIGVPGIATVFRFVRDILAKENVQLLLKASGVCVKNLPETREIGILHQPLNFGLRRERPSVLQGLSVGMIIP
jgi:hypothetical protein